MILMKPHIGRHPGAGSQENDIPRNQFLAVNFQFFAIPQHSGFGHHHLFEGADVFFRLVLLDVADQGINQ